MRDLYDVSITSWQGTEKSWRYQGTLVGRMFKPMWLLFNRRRSRLTVKKILDRLADLLYFLNI